MRAAKGFTLIELMITLSVLAIVLSLAAPSFSTMRQDSRIGSLSSELQSAIQFARAEAVKRHANVIICRRNAAGTACENGTNWAAGWLVRQVGGDIIKVWDSATSISITGPDGGVTFRNNGITTAAGNFSVTVSSCTGTQYRTISVSATGTTRLEKAGCPT